MVRPTHPHGASAPTNLLTRLFRRRELLRPSDVLPDVDRFDRLVRVEVMRADRTEGRFVLAAFDTSRARETLIPADFRFAEHLLTRLRATDHAGCMSRGRVGVILWGTDLAGAKTFTDSVLADCPVRPLPEVTYYAHPLPAEGRGGEDGDGSDEGADGPDADPDRRRHDRDQVRPVDDLFFEPLPGWKRTLDVAGASAGLVLLGPFLLLVGLLVRLTSPGPALFFQQRDGFAGRRFRIAKFRSMYIDAEERKRELLAMSEQDGPAFKMTNDPRITPLGRVLRKTCVDELPQLWNVLKGEMTLVGPRPLDSREAAECLPWQRRRRWITPGLTCIWQVDGKSRVSFDEWMRMDLRYLGGRGPVRDVVLIVRTLAAAVLSRASH
ncbi:MAG: sugar transferase [Planctomycetota bacterium]